ncbi:PEGA domain-containing protein, partial [Myxococcota bacterium]|nr:PEGA domain-containing protein [Myxococcota bacterium]
VAGLPGSSLPGVAGLPGSSLPGVAARAIAQPGASMPGTPIGPLPSAQPSAPSAAAKPATSKPQSFLAAANAVSGTQTGLPGSGTTPKVTPSDAGLPPELQNAPVVFRDGKPPLGAVPRAPMREQSAITRFDAKVGDSSRSVLIVSLAAAAALLAGVFFFSEPPPEVKEAAQQETRHNLPKDLVRAALENAKPADPAQPEEEPAADPQAATDPAAAATGEAKPGEAPDAGPPVERYGRLELSSDPAVDVYLGNQLLGRTPLTAKLESGSQQLRFTDKEAGLNIYKTYRIKGGALSRDHLSFGTSELVIEAPDGASILLNSRFVGKAPLDPVKIYEGKYHLKVTLDGKSWADTFEAPPGRRISYKVHLKDN